MKPDSQTAHATHAAATTATAHCAGAAALSPGPDREGKGADGLRVPRRGSGSTGYVRVCTQNVATYDVCEGAATRLYGSSENGVDVPLGPGRKDIIARRRDSAKPS